MHPKKRLDHTADAGESAGRSRLNTSVLARITKMAFRHQMRMAIAIIATVAAAVFQLFVPQFLGRAVDQAQGPAERGRQLQRRCRSESRRSSVVHHSAAYCLARKRAARPRDNDAELSG